MVDENKIRDAADAVKGIVEAVPVYEDVVQPAAREVGIALQTVARTIHVALAPVSALVWGYESIQEYVSTRVAEKLRSVPPERIQTPDPHVVGPALEAMRYTAHEESLREMYANLLATSLDSATCKDAHPSFVDIIKSMSPDEAKIMQLFTQQTTFPRIDVRKKYTDGTGYSIVVNNFTFIGRDANCHHQSLTPSYLDNLKRLGLLRYPSTDGDGTTQMAGANVYEPLESSAELEPVCTEIESADNVTVEFGRSFVETTNLGKLFCQACVIEKSAT